MGERGITAATATRWGFAKNALWFVVQCGSVERMTSATKDKEKGNAAVKAQDYKAAERAYNSVSTCTTITLNR